VVNHLSIGASPGRRDGGEVGNIRLLPNLSGGLLDISSVDLDENLLYDLIDAVTTDRGGSGLWLPFSEISVAKVAIHNPKRPRPAGYRLALSLGNQGGRLNRASLERLDGHMRLRFSQPEGDSPAILALAADDWVPQFGPTLHFDKVSLSGRVVQKALAISYLHVEGYGGSMDGQARLVWGHDWGLTAKVTGDRLRMAPIIEHYGGGGFDGLLSAKLTIGARAKSPSALLDSILVEGPFVIHKAVIDTGQGAANRMRIDMIRAKGKVDRWSFKTEDTLVEAYGGALRGVAETRWSASPKITGQVKVKGVQLEPLLDTLMARRPLSGHLYGDGRFALNAPTFRRIFHHPDLSANIRIDKGIMFETDLENLKEGQTPFNELSARVRMKGGQTLVSALNIESDRLSAEGWIKADNQGELDGKLAVSVQNTISLASVHVGVGGTLDDPSFLPATSSIIGGVIGTGLLGPGWGTALGVRLGQFLDSVTGDENEMEQAMTEAQGTDKKIAIQR